VNASPFGLPWYETQGRADAFIQEDGGDESMRPLETLRNEHGLIRQFLDNLALAVTKLEDEERPPKEFFEMAVLFARTFADRFHHIKEEHVMFVRLAQKNKGAIDGQIDALRHQHDRGRNYISAIAEALDGYAAEQPIQTSEVLENTAAYISLLRNHIHKEDHVFFPMVAEELSDQEQDELQVEFDKARRKVGENAFENSYKFVVDLGSMLVNM